MTVPIRNSEGMWAVGLSDRPWKFSQPNTIYALKYLNINASRHHMDEKSLQTYHHDGLVHIHQLYIESWIMTMYILGRRLSKYLTLNPPPQFVVVQGTMGRYYPLPRSLINLSSTYHKHQATGGSASFFKIQENIFWML